MHYVSLLLFFFLKIPQNIRSKYPAWVANEKEEREFTLR
jgi:hypothetical protein